MATCNGLILHRQRSMCWKLERLILINGESLPSIWDNGFLIVWECLGHVESLHVISLGCLISVYNLSTPAF